MDSKKEKKWKPDYTWVLVANVAYVLFFYLIMKLYS
ncbi:hypothetical protein SAMN05192550_1757 [Flavobacterium glycines]|uniref:Uncharacterized protein n=1 Tax=Flavobacterium glycines TaxID=551990 RepID=A0A1G8SB66_9FLAO|nr:hypothetical protein SAMN05192550_1757 [Flavobacterium glycines]